MAFTAGVANVLVAPSFRGFQAAIGKQVNTVMPAAGREAGSLFSAGMAQGIATSSGAVNAAVATATKGAATAAATGGTAAGRAFTGGVAAGMRAGVPTASTATAGMFAPAAQIAAGAGATAGRAFVGGARAAMITSGAMGSAGATMISAPVAQITSAGRGAGSGFLSRASTALSRGTTAIAGVAAGIGARMSGVVAGAGVAAGTGFMGSMMRSLGPLAAILGPAAIIGSGFSRFANIEDAEAKMLGLGYSAEVVEQTLEGSLAAVEGTSFFLDQAMGTATMMLAAGVEPGEELEGVLTLISDAAYIAGTDFAEMGDIFSQVASTDMVQGDIFNRLGRQGLPIVELLAEELDVAADEVRKLGSQGEISFADFAAAMETGLGGAATEGGRTTRNALADTRAAIMVFGEGVVAWMKPGITAVSDALTDFFTWATEGFEGLTEWADENSEWLIPLAVGAAAVAVAMTTAAIAVGAFKIAWGLMSKAFGLTPIGRVIYLVIGLVAALVTAWHTSETFRNVVTGVWEAIKTAVGVVVDWFTDTALPFLQGVWEGISSAASFMWNSVLKPVWGAIRTAWDGLMTAIEWAWLNILKPAWDAISTAAQWMWNTILSPVFSAIGTAFAAVGGWIADVWQNVIKLAWDLLVYAAQWMWNSVLKPVFSNISQAWDVLAIAIKVAWERVLKPAWEAVESAAQWMWRNVLKPAFDNISSAWDSMVDGIKLVWDTVLKPVWDAVAGFVEDTIVPGIQRGVEAIDKAWRSVANLFRRPINWVINTVWNDGLKAAFDNVAKAINSDARLPKAPTIPSFSRGSGGGGGGGTPMQAYAKGGLARPGWALVGEEGPELVNFDRPGRVYTAAETAEALAAGDGSVGRHFGIGGETKSLARQAWDTVTGWVRGGLASAADSLLSPLFSRVSNTVSQWGRVGSLGGDAITNAKDRLIVWIRGKDDEAPAGMDGSAPGSGAWRRPSRGPITSRYGPRSLFGGSFHAGIDIGGGGPVYAMADGTVFRTGSGILGGRTGLGIGISHGGGVFTYYGHNPYGGIVVRPGQAVNAGQRIGAQGATGNVTGIHTHVELHRGGWGRAVNPEQLGVFDSGGDLLPGMLGANLSRKPEVVLTNQVIHDINRLASSGSGGAGVFHLYDSDDVLIGTMRGHARSEIDGWSSGTRRAARAQTGGVR